MPAELSALVEQLSTTPPDELPQASLQHIAAALEDCFVFRETIESDGELQLRAMVAVERLGLRLEGIPRPAKPGAPAPAEPTDSHSRRVRMMVGILALVACALVAMVARQQMRTPPVGMGPETLDPETAAQPTHPLVHPKTDQKVVVTETVIEPDAPTAPEPPEQPAAARPESDPVAEPRPEPAVPPLLDPAPVANGDVPAQPEVDNEPAANNDAAEDNEGGNCPRKPWRTLVAAMPRNRTTFAMTCSRRWNRKLTKTCAGC